MFEFNVYFSGMNIPLRNITEVLGIILNESLKYHPNHIMLLKLKGDLQYGNYSFIIKENKQILFYFIINY